MFTKCVNFMQKSVNFTNSLVNLYGHQVRIAIFFFCSSVQINGKVNGKIVASKMELHKAQFGQQLDFRFL